MFCCCGASSRPLAEVAAETEEERNRLNYTDLDVVFVDCDDTLYFNNWATAIRLKNKIAHYTQKKLNLQESYAWQLYQKHGTALRGLLNENLISPEHVEEYLEAVHDIPLKEITRDLAVRKMFLEMNVKRWIFTASSREHARRCMKRVGVEDLFEGIIDCRDADLVTKHDPTAFRVAMAKAGATDPTRCLLLDDSVQNIRTAKQLGFKTCLVGLYERETGAKIVCPEADFMIDRLIDVRTAIPGLFMKNPKNRKERRFSSIGGRKLSMLIARIVSSTNSFTDEEDGEGGAGLEDSAAARLGGVSAKSSTSSLLSSKLRTVEEQKRLADNGIDFNAFVKEEETDRALDEQASIGGVVDVSAVAGSNMNGNGADSGAPPAVVRSPFESPAMVPQVVFVLGPPGSGKGTQCAQAAVAFQCLHLSAGDLLRAEQDDPRSEFGEEIRRHIKEGTLVPVELTVRLLMRAIGDHKRALIDGFPRSLDNLQGFLRQVGDKVQIMGVLYYEAKDEEELTRRILERSKTSGRADDEVEVLKKRFRFMREQTLPVLKEMEETSTVRTIDALRSVEEVWASTEMALDGFWQRHITTPQIRGTQ